MKYLITRMVLGFPSSIEISVEEFNALRQAKANLLIMLGLEEKLDLVVENFADYERELLNLNLRNLLSPRADWSSFRFDVQAISRRFTNFLMSCRLYVDQVSHDVSQMYGGRDSEQFRTLCQSMSHEYDQTFEYRFMDALRNHLQHRNLPLQALGYGMEWQEAQEPHLLQFSIVPGLDLDQLRTDPEFKKSVRDELSGMKEAPATPLVRRYMESIGSIHETIRTMTSGDVKNWDSIIASVETRAKPEFGDQLAGLAVIAMNEESGQVAEEVQIFQGFIQHRKLLQRKNHSLAKLSARYVTGVASQKDQK